MQPATTTALGKSGGGKMTAADENLVRAVVLLGLGGIACLLGGGLALIGFGLLLIGAGLLVPIDSPQSLEAEKNAPNRFEADGGGLPYPQGLQSEPIYRTTAGMAPATLAEQMEVLKSQLGLSGNMATVFKAAAEQLGVEAGGRPLVEVAAECIRVLEAKKQASYRGDGLQRR